MPALATDGLRAAISESVKVAAGEVANRVLEALGCEGAGTRIAALVEVNVPAVVAADATLTTALSDFLTALDARYAPHA